MEFQDYYKTLEVERTATPVEIKKSYRRLSKKYHPDVNVGSKTAEDKFKQLGEAYEVLKDPEKRRRYDQLGGRYGQGQPFDPGSHAGAGNPYAGWQNVEWATGGGRGAQPPSGFSDFFDAFFGGDVGGARGRGGRGPMPGGPRGRDPSRPRVGENHEAELKISLEDAFTGVTTTIALEHTLTAADGGRRREQKHFNVKVPANARDGMKIRLKGQGLPGHNGGADGDLLLTVRFKAHPRFAVDGADLTARLPIAPWEAALGAKVPFSTLDGEVKLTVPANSSAGGKLRLKGKGLPLKDGERGALTVEMQVVLPADLSDEERTLLEQWQSLRASWSPRST